MAKRKPKIGRPPLGDRKRSAVRITINLSRAEHDAIAAAVDRENAEVAANEVRKPATVSSWIRDHALGPLGLATHDGDA